MLAVLELHDLVAAELEHGARKLAIALVVSTSRRPASCGLPLDGKLKVKVGSLAELALDADAPAVQLDEALGEREAEARPSPSSRSRCRPA
jgi:hypothetical protein